MPLSQMPDTRIALSGGGGTSGGGMSGMLGTLGSMMQIKEQQEVMRQRQRQREREQRDLEDDDAIRSTLPKYDRPDEAIEDLYKQGRAEAAAKLGTSIYNERKAKAAAYDAQLVSAGKRLTQAAQIAQGVTDDATYRPARAALVQLLEPMYGATINDVLPTRYDATQMKALIAAGTTRAQQITAEHNAATELQTALDKGVDRVEKFTKIAANLVSQARDKAQADGYLATLYAMGAPKASLAAFQFDDADPEKSRQAAAKLGLTGKEEADIARATARDKVLEEQGAQRNRIAAQRALAAVQAAREGGGGRGSVLTAGRQSEVNERRNKRMEDAKEKYTTALKELEPDAKKQLTDDEKQLIDAEKDLAKRAYLEAQIGIANDHRNESGLPSFEEAAEAAIAKGDRSAYDKVNKEFNTITGGVPRLSKIVPWRAKESTTAAPTTPQARGQRFRDLVAERDDKTKPPTPTRRAEIEAELRQLLPTR